MLFFGVDYCGTQFGALVVSYNLIMNCLISGDPPRDLCLVVLAITWGKPAFNVWVSHPFSLSVWVLSPIRFFPFWHFECVFRISFACSLGFCLLFALCTFRFLGPFSVSFFGRFRGLLLFLGFFRGPFGFCLSLLPFGHFRGLLLFALPFCCFCAFASFFCPSLSLF